MNYKKRFDMGGKKTVYTGASPPEGTVKNNPCSPIYLLKD